MAIGAQPQPLVQLLTALQAEGIRFMLAGMSAANLQGVLEGTIDVDIWIGLPSRQYMRVINLCNKLGATLRSANKVFLSDDTPVDFIYEISGLHSFDWEYRRAKRVPFHGLHVPVLPLERICRSKQAAGRDKDKLHILLIRKLLRLRRAARRLANTAKKQRRSRSSAAKD
jgi:hypothetical protein